MGVLQLYWGYSGMFGKDFAVDFAVKTEEGYPFETCPLALTVSDRSVTAIFPVTPLPLDATKVEFVVGMIGFSVSR